jgi:HSP20 family protein
MSSDDDWEQYGALEQTNSGTFGAMGRSLFDRYHGSLRPLSKVDVSQERVTVTFDVPGVDKEDVTITCSQDSVSMEAEARKQFRSGGAGHHESSVEFVKYSEKVQVPVPIDPDRATARFKNGIIVVRLPRVKPPKRIKVSVRTEQA